MNTAAPAGTLPRTFSPSFFFWMTAVMFVFVFGGFGLTYLQPLAARSLAPLPPVVHLHGLFYFAWMLLLAAQTVLVGRSNLALHRSLGTFGIFVATGMMFLGALLTVLFLRAGAGNTAPPFYLLSYLSIVAVPSFGLLFCLGIRATRRPADHRRLMLLATIALLPPGINRLYGVTFGLTDIPVLATWLTMDALVLALAMHDWRTVGKVSVATVIGGAVVIGPQLLYPLVVDSAAFASLCAALGSLARYR